MKYYAIRKKDKRSKFIAGTDFLHDANRPRQILSNEHRPPKLFTELDLESELKRRHVDLNRYEVVAVEVKEAPAGIKVKKGGAIVPEAHVCRDCKNVMVYPYDEPCRKCLADAKHPNFETK